MSVVDHRRALHRIPELDNQLPETLQLVRSVLAALPCRVFSPITGSVCAWFDAGKSDAVAFRVTWMLCRSRRPPACPMPPSTPAGCMPAATTPTPP